MFESIKNKKIKNLKKKDQKKTIFGQKKLY